MMAKWPEIPDASAEVERLRVELEQARAQLREMALDVLAASGQAQEAYEAQLAAEAKVEELERQVPRFPDHMALIVEAKNAGLPERLQTLIAALEKIPEHMRQYQWQADAKQAFGSKWVRAICGDNGRGMGRQAIAEVVGHIDVADFIAAANPDTVSLMLGELATLRAERDDLAARLQSIQQSERTYTAAKLHEAARMRKGEAL